MTADSKTSSTTRRGKKPGRVEAAARLNRLGLSGMGGRRPVHGRHALAELIKRGLEAGGDSLSGLHGHMVSQYVADLGGESNITAFDRGLVRRLVAVDLDLALLLAMRDGAAKLSRDHLLALSSAIGRNSAYYSQLVKAVGGPGRRAAKVPGVTTVQRFSESEPVKDEASENK